ncbi:flippase [Liquorilactobacillus oeni]|uniref:Polysaccharide Transporter, PST family protein n=1 Tax=Liquorilactobacillus oeni DSM 19972 TaxID=1423777 RepID=A0A0R1MF46_9LACO|nr:flippase [Liquorilactobacillus oeni]KRL04532.1 Polysaccharide Transporter, PST family protein [Liquorilactobacillus oeni DSM 19972]
MKNSIRINYVYNVMYQFLAVAVPVITTPYISRVLGPSGVGYYNYVLGIVSYFGIFAITGTSAFGQREIAKRQGSIEARSVVFWRVFLFRIICTLIVSFFYLVFIVMVLPQYKILFLVNLFTLLSWVVDMSWYFQGMENFKVTSLRNSLIKISATILIFILVKKPSDLWLYVLIYALSNLFGNLSALPYLYKEVIFVKLDLKDIFLSFRPIMALFIPVIAIQLYTVLNKIMLGTFSTSEQVGYFSQANQIVSLLVTVISAYSGVLAPRIAALYSKKLFNSMKLLVDKALANLFFLSFPMICGLILLAKSGVPFFFGTGFKPVVNILYILSFLFVILGMGQMLGAFLIAIDRQRPYTVAVSIAAVVNLILNGIALYLHLGARGVAVASVISEIFATVIQIYNFKDFLSFKRIKNKFISYLIASSIMTFYILLLSIIVISRFYFICLAMLTGPIIYIVVLVLLKDEVCCTVLKRIMRF